MTISEYSTAVDAIRQFVDEITLSDPVISARSADYQAGYRDALVDLISLERLGPTPEMQLVMR